MAKKTQSSQMKSAYGQRFSQEDLTTPEENTQPQQLKTASYKEGGLPMLVALARNRGVQFASSKTTQKEKKVM